MVAILSKYLTSNGRPGPRLLLSGMVHVSPPNAKFPSSTPHPSARFVPIHMSVVVQDALLEYCLSRENVEGRKVSFRGKEIPDSCTTPPYVLYLEHPNLDSRLKNFPLLSFFLPPFLLRSSCCDKPWVTRFVPRSPPPSTVPHPPYPIPGQLRHGGDRRQDRGRQVRGRRGLQGRPRGL